MYATFASTVSVTENWHRLPREIVVSPYVVVLGTELDNAVSSLI